MFNWNETKEQCPKAFNLFICKTLADCEGWEIIENKLYVKDYELEKHWIFNIRDLYTFFDDHDLIVIVDICQQKGYGFNIYNPIVASNEYNLITENIIEHDKWYSERPEAEQAAFEKSFSILEERLNDDK
jgi:hypothetical protein